MDGEHKLRRTHRCDQCGYLMVERGCKLECGNCGYRFDCSDLTLNFDFNPPPVDAGVDS